MPILNATMAAARPLPLEPVTMFPNELLPVAEVLGVMAAGIDGNEYYTVYVGGGEILESPEGADALAFVRMGRNRAIPDMAEMSLQIATGFPAAVFAKHPETGEIDVGGFGDFLLERPLLGRPFRLSCTDCLEAVRAWYWQERGIALYTDARDTEWWKTATPMKDNNFKRFTEKGRFRRIDPNVTTPEAGDLIISQLNGSPVMNHIAAYIGDGAVYHHLPKDVSRVDPLGKLNRVGAIRHWVRFVG